MKHKKIKDQKKKKGREGKEKKRRGNHHRRLENKTLSIKGPKPTNTLNKMVKWCSGQPLAIKQMFESKEQSSLWTNPSDRDLGSRVSDEEMPRTLSAAKLNWQEWQKQCWDDSCCDTSLGATAAGAREDGVPLSRSLDTRCHDHTALWKCRHQSQQRKSLSMCQQQFYNQVTTYKEPKRKDL